MLAYEKGTGVRARVTKRFFGARDGQVHPEWHEVGTVVSGDLAKVAMSEGWADGLPENKALIDEKKRGGSTGQGKQSSSLPAGQALEKKTSRKPRGGAKSSS